MIKTDKMLKRQAEDRIKCATPGSHGHTIGKQGKRDNAKNNTRCTQARKSTHGLDGQHQDVDRTLHGRVNQKVRGQG